jgi:plastocyanin
MEAAIRLRTRWLVAVGSALAALLAFSPAAKAGVNGQCPPIADKPDAAPHVDYTGVEHLTYCYGPITIIPGQNTINLRPATDDLGNHLWPQEDGYITRFDPEFVYADGSVPRVDVLHLHHAVWLVNGRPQFAAGEEKTIQQLPQGFGWPNHPADRGNDPCDQSHPCDSWLLNDMLHDLIRQPAQVYVVWRLDFVPMSSPAAASIKPVRTKWLDVAGNPSLYPVFDALRADGHNGSYTFPDQAPPSDLHPCGGGGGEASWPAGSHGCLGEAQSWTPTHDVTLIGTAGHLHPGGLDTQLRDTRNGVTNTLFTSDAHYYEPAGEVSWDVSMGATTPSWRVTVPANTDTISVHATYDTRRADWYEVMGIMPVAVYNGTLTGPTVKDAQDTTIPQTQVLTHGHLSENDNHGGDPTGAPDPLSLYSAPAPNNTINIQSFAYHGDPNAGQSVPTIAPGQTLTFHNGDVIPSTNAFHTITACKDPCNGTTGIAYPIANGPVTFDSGELGYNGRNGSLGGAPASGTDTWKTPDNLPSGTYTYFCRIHPFMRGAFRVEAQTGPVQTLTAKKDQELGTAAVSETLDKPATVALQARVKGGKGAGQSSTSRALSQALDAKQSTLSLDPKVKTKIKLKFSKAARKRIRATLATGGSRKVVVTATATDRFGNTSTAKAGFRLTG